MFLRKCYSLAFIKRFPDKSLKAADAAQKRALSDCTRFLSVASLPSSLIEALSPYAAVARTPEHTEIMKWVMQQSKSSERFSVASALVSASIYERQRRMVSFTGLTNGFPVAADLFHAFLRSKYQRPGVPASLIVMINLGLCFRHLSWRMAISRS